MLCQRGVSGAAAVVDHRTNNEFRETFDEFTAKSAMTDTRCIASNQVVRFDRFYSGKSYEKSH